jgi:hypothetical protein
LIAKTSPFGIDAKDKYAIAYSKVKGHTRVRKVKDVKWIRRKVKEVKVK